MNHIKAQITEKTADDFTAVASTESVDRHGEVIKADGWDIKDFKNNPILLAYHDHTKPIGKATKIWIEKSSKGAKLMFKGFISSATDEARGIKQLMQEGILNSFSVGFMPVDMDGNTITKAELHEISVVSVPANAEARRVACKSLKDKGFDEEVIEKLVDGDSLELINQEDKIKQLEKAHLALIDELKAVRETAELAVKGLQYLAPQRSKQVVTTERLHHSKVIAKAADKLLGGVSGDKAAINAKIIKRSSEMLIRSHKGDL